MGSALRPYIQIVAKRDESATAQCIPPILIKKRKSIELHMPNKNVIRNIPEVGFRLSHDGIFHQVNRLNGLIRLKVNSCIGAFLCAAFVSTYRIVWFE